MYHSYIKEFLNSFLGGICIAMGGTAYLIVENKYVGAVLFCVGLLSICYMQLSLYTGKIGFLATEHTISNILKTIICLIGNLLAVILLGRMIAIALPQLCETATEMCQSKLATSHLSLFLKSIMCGILMYIAVWIFKYKTTPMIIFFAIPAFILSGFEHSIADAFYFGVSALLSIDVVIFIIIVLLGNTVGSLLFSILQTLAIKMGDKHE